MVDREANQLKKNYLLKLNKQKGKHINIKNDAILRSDNIALEYYS